MLCQGPGFAGAHLWLRPGPGAGVWGQAAARGCSRQGSREQGAQRDAACPSALLLPGLRASSPPSRHHPGVWIHLGPQEGGTATRQHSVPPSLSRLVPQPSLREAGSLEFGLRNPPMHDWLVLVIRFLTLSELENLAGGEP